MATLKKLLENHSVIDIRFKQCKRILIILKSKDGKKTRVKMDRQKIFQKKLS